jgi:hypothetical protein
MIFNNKSFLFALHILFVYQAAHVCISFCTSIQFKYKKVLAGPPLWAGGVPKKNLHRCPNPLMAALNEPGQAIVESLKAKSRDWVGGVPCTRSYSDEKSRHSSDVFRFQYVTQQDPCNDWIPAECIIFCIQAYSEASGDKRVTHFYSLFGRA